MTNSKEEWNQLDLSQLHDRGSKKWVAMMLPELFLISTLLQLTMKKNEKTSQK